MVSRLETLQNNFDELRLLYDLIDDNGVKAWNHNQSFSPNTSGLEVVCIRRY